MNTIQQFHYELNDLDLVIGIIARDMEAQANAELDEMVRVFEIRDAYREQREHIRKLREKLGLRLAGEAILMRRGLPDGPRSYQEQLRLYRQWRGAVAVPRDDDHSHHDMGAAIDTSGWVNAEDLEWDALRNRYRLNEPWHFEYDNPYAKPSTRWRRLKHKIRRWWDRRHLI